MKAFKAIFHSRLAARALAGVCIGAAALITGSATTSQAAIVYVDPPDIAVPADFNGVYLNVVTGATSSDSSLLPTYDLNLYSGSTGLTFYQATFGNGYILDPANNAAAALAPGTSIGSNYTYYFGALQGTNFKVTGTELLGFRFINETTGVRDYGWAEISTTSGTGFPAAITRYAYDDSGAAIAAGAVPEPGSLTALVTLGLGAVSLCARRLRRQAV